MRVTITLRQLFVITIVLLGAAQFVPVDLVNPPAGGPLAAPRPVEDVLRRACFDCHSHESRIPWYGKVAPVSWLVAHDIKEARAELNFSTWNQLGLREQEEAQRKIWQAVKQSEMPPPFYVLVHPEGRLTTDDHRLLRTWAGIPEE